MRQPETSCGSIHCLLCGTNSLKNPLFLQTSTHSQPSAQHQIPHQRLTSSNNADQADFRSTQLRNVGRKQSILSKNLCEKAGPAPDLSAHFSHVASFPKPLICDCTSPPLLGIQAFKGA